ncbi:MAG: DUF1963 domain-containing protein [Pseudomonadota bacterium]
MTGQAVFLHRISPRDRAAWDAARSWFGGHPCLGREPWPRTDANVPLTFLAQIALDDLPEPALPDGLPRTGSLAFFVAFSGGTPSKAVRFVPAETLGQESPPPDDLPPVLGDDVSQCRPDVVETHQAPTHFNRWPIRFATHDAETLARAETRFLANVDSHDLASFPLRPNAMTRLLRCLDAEIDGAYVSRRQDLIRGDETEKQDLLRQLAPLRSRLRRVRQGKRAVEEEAEIRAAVSRLETRLKNWNEELQDAMLRREAINAAKERLPVLLTRASGSNAFDTADQDEIAELYRALTERKADPEGSGGRRLPTAVPGHYVDQIRRSALRDHALANAQTWASTTEAERDFLDADLAEDLTRPHQMFGIGADIQGRGQVEGWGTILLLQLYHDEPMMWPFGDVGTLQFRIDRGDLEARDWDKVWVDFTSA